MSTQVSISEVTAQQAGVEEVHSDAPMYVRKPGTVTRLLTEMNSRNNRSHEGASPIADTDVPRPVKQDGLVDKLKHFFTFCVGHLKRKRTKKEKVYNRITG